MGDKGFLVVRAEVADPSDRASFEHWYGSEHMPEAAAAFKAERAWRCWSKMQPTVHYAFYQFSDSDAAPNITVAGFV